MIDQFENIDPEMNIYLRKYKRFFDLVLTIILLVITAPILIIAAILIKISSEGHVIYKQQRVGIYGKLFVCYKFRSMYNSGKNYESLTIGKTISKSTGVLDKRKDDKRITRIGSFLRQTSLDELPQLFNVLRGEMSLVGPRPLMPFMLKPYPEIMVERCRVMPGLTGLWQVKGRKKNTSVLDMIDFDLEYIKKANLSYDISILFSTIFAVIRRQGAY